jgi:hypothetical protein
MPTLKAGMDAKVDARYFSDLDLVPVKGGTVRVEGRNLYSTAAMIGGPLILLGAWLFVYRRIRSARSAAPSATGFAIPSRITPLNAVMTLRRVHDMHALTLDDTRRAELERDIAMLELKYFGPGNGQDGATELGEVLTRWAQTVAG